MLPRMTTKLLLAAAATTLLLLTAGSSAAEASSRSRSPCKRVERDLVSCTLTKEVGPGERALIHSIGGPPGFPTFSLFVEYLIGDPNCDGTIWDCWVHDVCVMSVDVNHHNLDGRPEPSERRIIHFLRPEARVSFNSNHPIGAVNDELLILGNSAVKSEDSASCQAFITFRYTRDFETLFQTRR
jgi:hypothetical protein